MPDPKLVRQLFEAASDLPAPERAAFLADRCGEDMDLHQMVEELLAADERGSDTPVGFEQPIGTGLLDGDVQEAIVGARIGAYQIRRILGSGGMSTVFEAEQDQPRRKVAVKTMRLGLLSPEVRRRFEYESEILGRLQHPSIAQVYEAGTWQEPLANQEVPFFAMEFVADARPFNQFVQEQQLDLEAALRLFLQVCDAVQYGHQLGFIHRDLKPANVLVDGQGQPKVIDFGIARATEVDDNQMSALTQAGQVLGTLQYMAPEQLDGSPDIDTRIDVYALGVMFYELLAGKPPHDPAEMPITTFANHVRNHEAPPPSSSSAGFAHIDSDLDWITRTATAADRSERYGAVSEFANDIQRYLNSEPVSVGPPSRTYYLRKFVRRNKVLVGGVGAVFVAMTLGIIGTTWQMFEADDARDKAERQFRKAETINDFYSQVLGFANPDEGSIKPNPNITVREAIEAASKRLEKLESEPDAKADLHVVLGSHYRSLTELEKSRHHLLRAVELRRKHLASDDPDLAIAINHLAITTSNLGDQDEALSLYKQALEAFRKAYGETHEQVGHLLINIGASLKVRGQLKEARDYLRRGIEVYGRLPDADRFRATGLVHLGMLEDEQSRTDAAVQAYRESLAAFAKADRSSHPYAASACFRLGHLKARDQKYEEANEYLGRAHKIFIQSYGADSINVARAGADLGLVRTRLDLFDGTETMLLHALAILEKRFDDSDHDIKDALIGLMELCEKQKRPQDAEKYRARYKRAK